jgi:hypothetical protein
MPKETSPSDYDFYVDRFREVVVVPFVAGVFSGLVSAYFSKRKKQLETKLSEK